MRPWMVPEFATINTPLGVNTKAIFSLYGRACGLEQASADKAANRIFLKEKP